MTEYSKYNIVYQLQKWMDSVPGQTALNYAYSWGASIVVLGTLFKLTHLPGANLMLFLGMGTEVLVFFLAAFDRPFDKTADGRDIPTHFIEDEEQEDAQSVPQTVSSLNHAATPMQGQSVAQIQAIVQGQELPSGQHATAAAYVPQMSSEEAEAMKEAQGEYVEELKKLVDTLAKVNEQSVRLTRDSEEMENLNRTLTGIAKVYELQLKGASRQISMIEQINDKQREMATQIEKLNRVYARMIEAMTVNMPHTANNTDKND